MRSAAVRTGRWRRPARVCRTAQPLCDVRRAHALPRRRRGHLAVSPLADVVEEEATDGRKSGDGCLTDASVFRGLLFICSLTVATLTFLRASSYSLPF
ncbi:hypothetical protein NDU88_012903 [Pleurodeles waltl]|uniref:Uncharacterized protein n=1 Tax=Pleurodeles waltl TaxID=8319 RepID=A0AAV7R1F8_PLEWA|nr:hypothetical protein NDU88_012903 [Pleurodeles waltl]